MKLSIKIKDMMKVLARVWVEGVTVNGLIFPCLFILNDLLCDIMYLRS